ncbi:MAG: ribosome maturation factor RimP [Elusimicrobia bacterium]|nr:ribosome maturation factor RimP [Elusimicrobiota bacterium]
MSIIKQLEDLIGPIAQEMNMELVDVQFVTEYGKKVLRIFLDKEGGFGLKDCEEMSSKIAEILDKSDILTYSYILEVSSPGLERVLKKEKDFVKFLGKNVKISVFEPINGQRHFHGTLTSCQNGRLIVDDITGKTVTIDISKIAKACLSPDTTIK